MSNFDDAPNNINKHKAVLNKDGETYSPLDEVDGKQPYYSYQGVGSLTGGNTYIVSVPVTHLGINVTFNNEFVIHNN